MDFNLNVLNYNKNENVTKFLNLTFEHGLVPVINKTFLIAETEKRMQPEGKVQITKRLINNKSTEKFKNALQEVTWDDIFCLRSFSQ